MRFLQQWRGELVLISHDREFMDSVTTHTMGIHRKQMRKVKGDTTTFFTQILEQETVHERTRLNQEKKRSHLQSYIDRFGAKASKATQAQSRQKILSRLPVLEQLKALYQLEFNFHQRPFHGKKLVDVKQIDFSYPNSPTLIQDVSLDVEKGERVAIIGKNGYGKSTLLRLIAGELAPQKGQIRLSDQATIGYFGQTNIERLKSTATIEEEIAAANPNLNFTEIRGICGQMMFAGDAAKKKIGVLSGGEKSRVLLGKILAKPCNFLLLDEPTHHLDVESIEALIDALEDFEGAFVIVTHSELILKRLNLHKLIICHQDRQDFFLGSYDEFLEKIGWEEETPTKEKSLPKKQDDRFSARAHIKALETELRKIEKKLAELEEIQKKENFLLEEASNQGQTQALNALFASTQNREAEIQALYEKFMYLEKQIQALKVQ